MRPSRSSGIGDRTVGGQVARTAREVGDGAHFGLFDDLRFDALADIAAGDAVHMLQRLVGVRNSEKGRHRRPVLQAFSGNRHIGSAKLHAVDEVDFLAERFIREDFDLHPTVGKRLHLLAEFHRCLVPDVFLVREVAKFQRDVGGHRRACEHDTSQSGHHR